MDDGNSSPILSFLDTEMVLYSGGQISLPVEVSSSFIHVSVSASTSSLLSWIWTLISCVLLTADLQLTSPQCSVLTGFIPMVCIIWLNAPIVLDILFTCCSSVCDTIEWILWNSLVPALLRLYPILCFLNPSKMILLLVTMSKEKYLWFTSFLARFPSALSIFIVYVIAVTMVIQQTTWAKICWLEKPR